MGKSGKSSRTAPIAEAPASPLPHLVSDLPSDPQLAGGGPWLLCPWLRGRDPGVAFWIGALPWHDANAALLQALAKPHSSVGMVYAGIFCVDPFRTAEDLYSALHAAAVTGIVNLPSVSVFDGELGSLLASFDLGIEREVAFLRNARAAGFHIAGCASSTDVARRLVEAGVDFLIAHGGAPHGKTRDPSAAVARRLRRAVRTGIPVIALGDILGDPLS